MLWIAPCLLSSYVGHGRWGNCHAISRGIDQSITLGNTVGHASKVSDALFVVFNDTSEILPVHLQSEDGLAAVAMWGS